MDNSSITQTIDYNIQPDQHHKPKRHRHKSPSTKAHSWRRAIAWRIQMGFLPRDYVEDDTLPSLVASDVVQQQFLGAMEYIDDLCLHGALDPEAARPLRRCLLEWTTQEIRLMNRIEELEIDLLTLENRNSNDNSNIKTHTQTQNIGNTNTSKIQTKQPTGGNTKCTTNTKFVTFVSGGLNDDMHKSPHTNTKQNTLETSNLETHPTSTSQTETNTGNRTNHPGQKLPQHNTKNVTGNETSDNISSKTNTDKRHNETNDKTNNTTNTEVRSYAAYALDYNLLEENIRLSRLENPQTFQTALRLVTRLMHPKGADICFPYAEMTDRLMLRVENIPTNGHGLCNLLRKVLSRRGESFNLDGAYRDLARAYGRVYLNMQEVGPKSLVYTRYP